MPELPEVETITRSLEKTLVGSTVTKLKFFRADIRKKIPTASLEKVLVSAQITAVFRRSKYILLETKKGYCIFHLGMTGNIILSDSRQPLHDHTHAIFSFIKDKETFYLHFIDPRRFGQIEAHEGREWQKHPLLNDLGIEPLVSKNLPAYLWQQTRNRSQAIKSFIMNGSIVVGVGNIYACEALFKAKIHPLRKAQSLTEAECKLLANAIIKTLNDAIAQGGTSFRDFKNTDGKLGYFAVHLQVYGRKNEPCYICKTPIATEVQAGRSLWYCPQCQPVGKS
jgi:formamidopyrimidine-DNA glycosylase